MFPIHICSFYHSYSYVFLGKAHSVLPLWFALVREKSLNAASNSGNKSIRHPTTPSQLLWSIQGEYEQGQSSRGDVWTSHAGEDYSEWKWNSIAPKWILIRRQRRILSNIVLPIQCTKYEEKSPSHGKDEGKRAVSTLYYLSVFKIDENVQSSMIHQYI